MKHSASNPARQRTVFTVLLVWLLASGYSWANFCLMQENGSPWDASSASASPIVPGSQSSPGHAHADINHHEQGEGVEKACHDAFRDSTHGIVKSASRTDSVYADMFILVAPRTWAAFPSAPTAISGFWPDLPASDPEVPLRTRLSRLAL